ncbi:dihydrofolate reductase [Frankia umida]
MIGLVLAQSVNGVIGRDGTLPWYLPEDLEWRAGRNKSRGSRL